MDLGYVDRKVKAIVRLKRIHQLRKHLCKHGLIFDDTKINDKMSTAEVRKMYPRLDGACPLNCGYSGIAYASYQHYTFGDW